jgi:hypothetical protein
MTNNFDWIFYIKLYEDLILNNINTEESALKHWNTIGKSENRICNKNIKNFNWKEYLLLNPDLIENNINTEEDAVIHWLKNGIKENRNSGEKTIDENIKNFDWKFYLKMYDDLKYNNIDTEEKALNHWNNIGKNENRICNKNIKNFNWKKYLSLNPDLVKNNINTEEDSVIHWLKMGQYENRIFDDSDSEDDEDDEDNEDQYKSNDHEEDNKIEFDKSKIIFSKSSSKILNKNENIEIIENIDLAQIKIENIEKLESLDSDKKLSEFIEDEIKNIEQISEKHVSDIEAYNLPSVTEVYEILQEESKTDVKKNKSKKNKSKKNKSNKIINESNNDEIICSFDDNKISDKPDKCALDKPDKCVSDKPDNKISDKTSPEFVELKSISVKILEETPNLPNLLEKTNENIILDQIPDLSLDIKKIPISNLISNLILDIKSELHSDGKSELHSDGKSELHSDGKSKLHSDGKSELHSDGKSELHSDGKSELAYIPKGLVPTTNTHYLSNIDRSCERLQKESNENEKNNLQEFLKNDINDDFFDEFCDELFDWEFYINYYSDLKNILTNKESAYNHWITRGKSENRYYNIYSFINTNKILIENNFDWIFYIKKYNDLNLTINNEKNKEKALNHWVLIGKNEGRYINKNLENNFDWIFYRNNIKNININSESDALSHYYNYGIYDNIPYKSNKLKYSILIVYNNNKNIIIQILNRFEKKYKNNYNYEIIIVDNASNEENILDKSILDNYCFDIKYLYLDNYEINNSICYNKGFNFATGNIIIIQNAECLHLSNILENIKDLNFKDNFYIVPTISCSNNIENSNILNKINNKLIYSKNKDIRTSTSLTNLDNILEFTKNSEEIYEKNIIKYLENESYSYKYSISKGWINHNKYLNDSTELTCLIISKENLDMLEGFNETYCMDYSYEYNELLYRAKNFLILNYIESSIIINLFYDKNILSENSNKLEYDNLSIDNLDINKKKYDNFINSDNKNISWKIYEKIEKENENYSSKIYYNNFNTEIIKNNKTINNTFVTFIIPTIGRESLIDTVNSLLNLNNKNWKAIIIFDRVENKFNINDNRISIIETNYNSYKINKSSFVRNIGLKNIDNTEWVAFVDDDDYISPNYLDCFINELKDHDDLEACIFRMGYKNKFVIPSKYDNSIIKCKVGISFVVKEFIAKKTYFKDDLFEEYLYLKELDNNNYKIIISEYVTYFVKTEPFEAEKYKKVLINF